MKRLRGADLTHGQFRVAVMLSTYTSKDGSSAYPGARRLAEDCAMTERGVRKLLGELEVKGWIRQDFKGGNLAEYRRASEYTITVPRVNPRSGRVNGGSVKGEPGFTASDHSPEHSDHSESEHSASLADANDDTKVIQAMTRSWDHFNDLEEIEVWLDKHLEGWRLEYDLENAVWMMWENDRHPRSILEYACSRFGMKLAA